MDALLRRILTAAALVLVVVPFAAAQQNSGGAPWAAWRGCWRLVSEAGVLSNAASQPMVCVTETQNGARLTTTVPGQPAIDQLIQTDGREQKIEDSGCQGTQRAEWSPSGPRLYSTATLTCSGDPAPRRVSGYALLLQDGTWLDIQAVDVNQRDSIRIRRYQRIDSATSRTPPAGRALSVDDVKEASGRVSVAAVEAAIVESGARLPLSGRTLIELDTAGVADKVIDLMVAVSYPDRFVIERSARTDRGPLSPLIFDDPFMYGMFGLPVWSARWGYYGSYWDPYYYSPFAYSYYGRYYDPYYASTPVFVTGGGGSIDVPPQPTGRARAVDGRGYTQTRPREVASESAPRTTTNSGGSPAPDTSSSSGSSSSSSSSGGSVSSSGFSNGGGGGDTGRTAVPR